MTSLFRPCTRSIHGLGNYLELKNLFLFYDQMYQLPKDTHPQPYKYLPNHCYKMGGNPSIKQLFSDIYILKRKIKIHYVLKRLVKLQLDILIILVQPQYSKHSHQFVQKKFVYFNIGIYFLYILHTNFSKHPPLNYLSYIIFH